MRFVCVDLPGTADDDAVVAAVERARGLAADDGRILLFAQAARLASRRHREARAQREGAWLDAAAEWLLDDGGAAGPPQRPQADVFDERAVAVVTSRTEALSLPATDRFLELVDGLLVMAVPHDASVDAVDNAHLWLIGGAAFAVESRPGGRALVRVGGAIVVAEVGRGEAVLTAHALGGDDAPATHVVSLVPSAKMAVRGGR
jgi:hypothetical protein